jgi:hypothetical protein
MASPINNYQASALAARLAATYLTNQNNVNAPANAGAAKPASDAPATDANGASGGSSPANSDGVILSLSDEAKQLLASLQQGLQQGLQPNNQPTSLAAFLNANGQNDDQQNDLLSAYSGAIKQFQQWLSQPPQPKTAPTSAPADTAPAKEATDADSSAAPSGNAVSADSGASDGGTSGSNTSGGGVAS